MNAQTISRVVNKSKIEFNVKLGLNKFETQDVKYWLSCLPLKHIRASYHSLVLEFSRDLTPMEAMRLSWLKPDNAYPCYDSDTTIVLDY